MRSALRYLIPLVIACGLALGVGVATEAEPTQPTTSDQYQLPNSAIQWVKMPPPGPHLNSVWCVVVNGAANGGRSGAGVTCDWDANMTTGGANTP